MDEENEYSAHSKNKFITKLFYYLNNFILNNCHNLIYIFKVIIFYLVFGGEIYDCKMKNNYSKNFQQFKLIIYQNFLIFAINENKEKLVLKIKYKYALRYIEVQIDKLEAKILNLIAKEKHNYIDLSVSFDDSYKSSKMKKLIEENRKNVKNTENLLLDSYFDNQLMKMSYKK